MRFHDSFLEKDSFCIVTELCEVGWREERRECVIPPSAQGGDLDQMINQRRESGRDFEETLITDWLIQLAAAVMYIHERRVLHRDIKTRHKIFLNLTQSSDFQAYISSRNIFLKRNLIKLGDFGISRLLLGTTDMASTFTGTPHYMSPEALRQSGYNSKSDIW